MNEIRFYHLERQNMLQALPGLLSKVYEKGHRIVVKCANAQDVRALNEHLWTYNSDSFLPHGSAQDDAQPEAQPVWITQQDESPNGADVLIITDGSQAENIEGFTLCCDIFDGRDSESVSAARVRWGAYKESGSKMTYWQQGEGGWEKKGA